MKRKNRYMDETEDFFIQKESRIQTLIRGLLLMAIIVLFWIMVFSITSTTSTMKEQNRLFDSGIKRTNNDQAISNVFVQ